MTHSLDIFIHAHPDDIELFMGIAVKQAIDSNHKVVMLLATAGDGGRKNTLLEAKNGNLVRYPEARLLAHDAAIKHLVGSSADPILSCHIINGHILTEDNFDNRVYSYNLMLPDGYRGVGFAGNNFETLEKLYLGKIQTIKSIDNNVYHNLNDLKNTIVSLLSLHIATSQKITFHIPEFDEIKNKGAHSDHFHVSRLMMDLFSEKAFTKENRGGMEVKLYSDYINASKPINVSPEMERFHRDLNDIMDDVLIANGRPENVRTLHLAFLAKEYVTSSFVMGG